MVSYCVKGRDNDYFVKVNADQYVWPSHEVSLTQEYLIHRHQISF